MPETPTIPLELTLEVPDWHPRFPPGTLVRPTAAAYRSYVERYGAADLGRDNTGVGVVCGLGQSKVVGRGWMFRTDLLIVRTGDGAEAEYPVYLLEAVP